MEKIVCFIKVLIVLSVFDFNNLRIYEGTTDKADVHVNVSDEDFFLIGTRKCTAQELVEQVSWIFFFSLELVIIGVCLLT